ncbi:MAG: hypothetical protein WBL63_04615 [Candidatus Acidiferrum sp.]
MAKRIKRGGACLLAYGFSSSDANRATHRVFGRCSGEAAFLVVPFQLLWPALSITGRSDPFD